MSERHTSPALRQFPDSLMHAAPLSGVEARMYDGLWRAMVEGKLKSGTKLREDVIGDTFGVSRTLVRKVLLVMEQAGLVDLPPNRGAYVATPTPADAVAVHDAYLMTMLHVVQKLADRNSPLSDEQRALIQEHSAAQADAEMASDIVAARILSGEFMVLLTAIHGNPILANLAAKMMLRFGLACHLYQSPFQHQPRAEMQRTLLEHILAHRTEAAENIIRGYFRSLRQTWRFDTSDSEVDLKSILAGESWRAKA